MISIGIFTKFEESKNRYSHYHNSPCKIYKILDELSEIIELEYRVNDYSVEYDFAICDRYKPKRKIKSSKILNFSENKPRVSWATHYCTTTLGVKLSGANQFYLLNYCQGRMLSESGLSKNRSGAVFLGRITGVIEYKIKILSKHISVDLYPIKYWRGKEILRFYKKENRNYLDKKFKSSGIKNIRINAPRKHNELYAELNRNSYKIGFVPSVYSLGTKKKQVASSSKFFEYIGVGIPVLIESNVPEAKLVGKNPFLGEVYSDRKNMEAVAKKMRNKQYDYIKILNYANNNHFADSRAARLYKKFIT